MKKGFLLILLISSFAARSQSLKDALYSGKLKNEPGTVIRKGDDLSTKIDTSTRKAPVVDTLKIITVATAQDSAARKTAVAANTTVAATGTQTNNPGAVVDTVLVTSTTEAAAPKEATPAKENNALWKAYADTIISTLKTEALTSKKVKSGSYYVLVSYVIAPDGQVTVGDVFVSPENAFLQQQVKDRFSLDAPRLNPVLSSTGTPRKVSKKYNFTLVKE